MYQMQGIIKISVEVPFNQKKVVVHNKRHVGEHKLLYYTKPNLGQRKSRFYRNNKKCKYEKFSTQMMQGDEQTIRHQRNEKAEQKGES